MKAGEPLQLDFASPSLPTSAGAPSDPHLDRTKWPKVITYSAFRNCESFIPEFFARRDRLTYPKDRISHLCVEGDSEDGTFQALQAHAAKRSNTVLKKVDSNSPQIVAFPHPGRAIALAKNSNYVIRALLRESDADYVLWIESDLDYPPDLIERLLRWNVDFVSPMVFIKGTRVFYDTYAFRQGNDARLAGPGGSTGCFQQGFPFHPAYREDRLFEVDSTGSCLFFKREILRTGPEFSPKGLIVSFCNEVRARGFKVWVDPTTEILHPVPNHVRDVERFKPWDETKILTKCQKTVPVDSVAAGLGDLYGYARSLEFGWIAQRMLRDPGTKTLDLASQASGFAAYCASLGLEATATDSSNFSEAHEGLFASCGRTYRLVTTESTALPFPEGSFDQVVALQSIARTKDDRALAAEAARVCRAGGRLFLTLPYDHHAFWWDDCMDPLASRYYYDMQALMERVVRPLGVIIRDMTFMHFGYPADGKAPEFSHPNNACVVALELEKAS